MVRQPLPRGVGKAIEWLEAEPARPWRLADLAAVCGIAPRTLQKHFRRFLGRAPLAFLRELRFDRARQELLRSPHTARVTEIATRCGFSHLGRFATEYHRRYGESPSATLRRSRCAAASSSVTLPVLTSGIERPTIAILPFECVGPQLDLATAFSEEIAIALWRLHWINVVTPPRARYHLHGKVRHGDRGYVRVTATLLDASTGRHIWAAGWESDLQDPNGFEERVAIGVSRAIQPALRSAEIDRALHGDRADLTPCRVSRRSSLAPKIWHSNS